MDAVKIELIVELIVVILAPPLHQYYLWKTKRTTAQAIQRTAKVFAPLYGGLVIVLLAAAFS
jgi:hypothetical protein